MSGESVFSCSPDSGYGLHGIAELDSALWFDTIPLTLSDSTQQRAESEMKMKKKITAKKLTGAKGKKANTSRNARSEEPISRRKEERSKSF